MLGSFSGDMPGMGGPKKTLDYASIVYLEAVSNMGGGF